MGAISFTQCLLKQGNRAECVSWIPTRFAVRGRVLRLQFTSGWTDGWIVRETYHSMLKPIDAHSTIRRHRRMTGDALPRQQPPSSEE